MASESKSKSSSNSTNTNKNTTKRKHRYLPYNFYEELVHGKASGIKLGQLPDKPLNKKTKFTYSDSSSSDDDDDDDDNEDDDDQMEKEEDKDKPGTHAEDDANHESSINANPDPHKQKENKDDNKEAATCHKSPEVEGEEPPTKKQCLETGPSNGNVITNKVEEKSIDKLIEAELEELTDRSKRHFSNLDSGCNGVVFVQMHKKDGDRSPKDIVQHMMMSIASTRKHMSRFILRVLPVEVTCYASEDEITRAIQPLISQYFPVETQTALKLAVLYEARANTGIDRMKIINAVAKSVPAPHKVDLNNPDKNIVVQIVKEIDGVTPPK